MQITISGIEITIHLVPEWLSQYTSEPNPAGILNDTDLELYQSACKLTQRFLTKGLVPTNPDDVLSILQFIYGPLVDPETPLHIPAVHATMVDTNTIVVRLSAEPQRTISHENFLAKQLMNLLVPIYGIESLASDTQWLSSYIELAMSRQPQPQIV